MSSLSSSIAWSPTFQRAQFTLATVFLEVTKWPQEPGNKGSGHNPNPGFRKQGDLLCESTGPTPSPVLSSGEGHSKHHRVAARQGRWPAFILGVLWHVLGEGGVVYYFNAWSPSEECSHGDLPWRSLYGHSLGTLLESQARREADSSSRLAALHATSSSFSLSEYLKAKLFVNSPRQIALLDGLGSLTCRQ